MNLTMNLVSSFLLFLNRSMILFYFSAEELFPFASRMLISVANTLSIVRGGASFFTLK